MSKEKKSKPLKVVGFDTETEQFLHDGQQYNWLMSIQIHDGVNTTVLKSDFTRLQDTLEMLGPERAVERNRKDLSMQFLNVLANTFTLETDNMLFALNLSFDASQIDVLSKNEGAMYKMSGLRVQGNGLANKADLITANGQVLGGELHLKKEYTPKLIHVKVRDIGRFYMGGLDAVAEDVLGRNKYKDPDLLKSYPFENIEQFNEWWHVTLFGNYEYATRDAIITQEVGQVIADVYGDKLTISSASMDEFKNDYMAVTGKEKANDLFWPTDKDQDVYQLAKEAAAGGLTLSPYNEYAKVHDESQLLVFDNVLKLDITSAYPTGMKILRYVKPVLKERLYYLTLDKLKKFISNSDQYVLINFTALTFDYPDHMMTDIVKTHRLSAAQPYFTVKTKSNMTFNNITARRFLDRAINISFDIASVYTFDYDPQATEAMHNYVLRNFNIKNAGKKHHNKIQELEGKSKLNNLSGKFNQHLWQDEYLVNNELSSQPHDESNDPHWYNPLMYSEITAFTRAQMTDAIEKLGIDKTLQVDTDSLKISVQTDEEIADYKRELKLLNDQYADPETGLGIVKEEGYFKSYMVLQRKVHGGIAISEKGVPNSMADFDTNIGEHHWAHAGMRNEAFDAIADKFKDDKESMYQYMLTEPEYHATFARRGKYGKVVKQGIKQVKSTVDLTDVLDGVRAGADFSLVVDKLRTAYKIELRHTGNKNMLLQNYN